MIPARPEQNPEVEDNTQVWETRVAAGDLSLGEQLKKCSHRRAAEKAQEQRFLSSPACTLRALKPERISPPSNWEQSEGVILVAKRRKAFSGNSF